MAITACGARTIPRVVMAAAGCPGISRLTWVPSQMVTPRLRRTRRSPRARRRLFLQGRARDYGLCRQCFPQPPAPLPPRRERRAGEVQAGDGLRRRHWQSVPTLVCQTEGGGAFERCGVARPRRERSPRARHPRPRLAHVRAPSRADRRSRTRPRVTRGRHGRSSRDRVPERTRGDPSLSRRFHGRDRVPAQPRI